MFTRDKSYDSSDDPMFTHRTAAYDSEIILCTQITAKCKVTLLLNSGRSVSIHVNKPMKHFFQKYCSSNIFPQRFQVFGKVFKMQIMVTRQFTEILTKIRACEQLQKSCEHGQASTHLIFASNSSRGKILRALSN